MRSAVRSTLACLLTLASVAWSMPPEGYTLVSPTPGSGYARPETGILLRPTQPVTADLDADAITVFGDLSGWHDGELQTGAGGQSLYFKPDEPFLPGERVEVQFTGSGNRLPAFTYEFAITRDKARDIEPFESGEIETGGAAWPALTAASTLDTLVNFEKLSDYDLPASMPPYLFATSDEAAPGYTYMSHVTPFYTDYLSVVYDDSGRVVFYGFTEGKVQLFQPDDELGLITYFNPIERVYHMMDTTWQEVRTLAVPDQYLGDFHECTLFPDGRAAILCREDTTMDLTAYGGMEEATVIGTVLQVYDSSNVLLFEWRSFAEEGGVPVQWTNSRGGITSPRVDYMHSNAIEEDVDGNWLISSRHTDAIYKIDANSAKLIWAMGGTGNQFTFTDTGFRPFSGQHDIRRLLNGNLMMFDNGSFIGPTYGRALEMTVDEDSMTVATAWSYDRDQLVHSAARGSSRRLANGNTIIAWGSRPSGNPHATEVNAAGEVVSELQLLENSGGYKSNYVNYRVYRSSLQIKPSVPLMLVDVEAEDNVLYFAKFNDPDVIGYELHFHEATSGIEYDTTVTATSLDWSWLDLGQWDVVSRAVYADGFSGYSDTLRIYYGVSGREERTPPQLPESFIAGVYPNPFNSTTTVVVRLRNAGDLRMELFDVLGRQVFERTVRQVAVGERSFTLDLTGLASGSYLLRVELPGGAVETRNLVHVK